ncbi:MAG: hypothetical protein ACE5D2_08485, partial [Fidelibacterota bacterium]
NLFPDKYLSFNRNHEGGKPMKKSFAVIVLFCFGVVFAQRSGGAEGVVNINDLPENSKAIFDDIKTKFVKKEKAFLPAFIQVNFATRATYKARYEKAAIHGGPKAEVTVILKGVSDEVMQEITDQAEAMYEDQLKAAGFTVVPYSALDGNKGFQKMIKISAPRKVETKIPALLASSGTTHLKIFTAHDGPIYSAKSGLYLYKMQSKLKKALIIHTFTINFSTYKTEKAKEYSWDKVTTSVQVEALPLITLGSGSSWVSSKSKSGMLRNKQVWSVDKDWVTGGEQIDDNTYSIVADPAVFKEACLELIGKNIELTVAHIRSLSK